MAKNKKFNSNRTVTNQKLAQVQTLFAQGIALHEQGQLAQAQAFYEQVLNIQPHYFDAIHMCGVIACQQKKYQLGYELISKAIHINNPNIATTYKNLGLVLQELRQLDAAIASYDRAIAIKPDYAEAHYNRGNALNELKQLVAAAASYDRAIAIMPYYAEAYYNRGIVLQELKQLDAALQSYDKALQIRPDLEFLYGMRLHIKMQLCDWDKVEMQFFELENKILHNEIATSPLPLFGIKDSLGLQRKSAELFSQHKFPVNPSLGLIAKRPAPQKIRIGYYSADFGEHPVSYLTAGLYESHDRSKFEIIAFSLGYHADSEMRKRLLLAFDQFIDVRDKSDEAVAQLSRDLAIDIAVDLGGHTKDSRTGIFACRAAPLQINYLGFSGTMGTEYIDYLIADHTLIPPECQSGYSEKIVYLPDSYMVNDRQRQISEIQFTRQNWDLPETGFVFCCFNNSYKITPAIFEIWMRILNAVEGSVLWLREDNPVASSNLKKEAERRGVNAERLIFAKRAESLADHLARHRQADLFIDTLPYNAHTTTSDALWASLPVLTCRGESFASRVAASLLNAIHLPELITSTLDDYEQRAIELAKNPGKLAEIKQQLATNRLTTPLFDTQLFTQRLEAAYTQIYQRYQADLPPDHIYIQS